MATEGSRAAAAAGAEAGARPPDSHWVRWHLEYENPASPLSLRLRIVQTMVRDVLDTAAPGPFGIVSLCAGQGRDVVDVVAGHPRATDVRALLVELDPALVAFARHRAEAAGLGECVEIVEGDAAQCRWYAHHVPAELVLVCGVFGNVSDTDIARTVAALPGFCRPGAEVIWTRHRRPPDATPAIRAAFAAAGFEEVAFEAPDGYVLTVGRERLRTDAAPVVFDPGARLFEFVGDGFGAA
jgi:putative methyltransferase